MDKMSSHGSMVEQLDLSRIPRSGFDKSHHNFMTGKLGKIIPTRIKEVYPGDRIKGTTHIVTNFEPLAAPIMANMVQKDETFFVPMSIIWNKAHRFFTGKKGFEDPMPSITLSQILSALENYNLIVRLDGDFSITAGTRKILVYQSGAWQLNYYALSAALNLISGNIISVGDEWEIRDLLLPYHKQLTDDWYKINQYLIDYHSITNTAIPEYTPIEKDGDLYNLIVTFFGNMYNWWFGASSMLDYLGVHHEDYISWARASLETTFASDNNTIVFYVPTSQLPINWLPIRGAYFCWYWYYRDQLLELNAYDPEEEMLSSDISDREIICCLLIRQRCWFKDTFTTALNNTGDGNVVLPTALGVLENTKPLEITEVVQQLDDTKDKQGAINGGANVTRIKVGDVTYDIPSNYLSLPSPVSSPIKSTTSYGLSLDLFDRARRLSSWLSKRLVLGTEYDDVVYSSFMVKLSNVKMRIPELLDTTRTQVAINVVVNNTTIPNGQIAGDKSAIAWADNGDNLGDGVNYYAEEHGYLYSFMTIMPIQSYPNGIQRLYLRQNRFDYYWPEFAQMGYDAVYSAELSGTPTISEQDKYALSVFGYQGRYYDLKSDLDEEHGRLLTDLSYLTFGRKFGYDGDSGDFPSDTLNAGMPKLNYMFVHCWPSLDPFVVDDVNADLFRSDIHFRYAWERNMPVPSEILR